MNPTRRTFLSSTLAAPALVTAIQPAATAAPPLNDNQLLTLRAAMDLIIPADGPMPKATDAGALGYIERVLPSSPRLAAQLTESLAVLEAYSLRTYNTPFPQLTQPQRIALLREMEATAPPQFAALRNLVYESYYTQPAIWKLIGYELYSTDHGGPHMAPFDESLLEDVRNRGPLYREV
jgi:hypothetical protein